jgi:hypothetical protein
MAEKRILPLRSNQVLAAALRRRFESYFQFDRDAERKKK